VSDDHDSGWTGWGWWGGRWTKLCEGATQVGAAKRLEARARLLGLTATKVRLLPAREGAPGYSLTGPRPPGGTPYEFKGHATTHYVRGTTRKEGRNRGQRRS
jgi:hypothetical protein